MATEKFRDTNFKPESLARIELILTEARYARRAEEDRQREAVRAMVASLRRSRR